MSILILSAHTQSTDQMVLTSADRKEILSVLFEREIASSQNQKEVVIQLSPRTDRSWLLDLPGVRFQQLSYEQEGHVPEYYEFRDIKIQRDFVELWLSKGNYCKKTGTGYQFRKEEGKWKAKPNGFSEISTSSGTVCVGCKTGSGSVYGWKKNGTAQATQSSEPKTLRLTGKALGVRCRRTQTKYIRCEVDLSLNFSNRGNEPIIIVRPHGNYEFWQGARSLAVTKADSDANNYVYSNAAWPGFYDTDEYRLLAEALDQATPPASLTRAIAPGESWTWTTTTQLALAEENTCSGSVGVEIGWKEIKKLPAPIWLEVAYEMWPFNVETFRKDLGGKLRERWKKYGSLYLEEKANDYWSAHLTSEPIELDFKPVELK